MVLWGRSVLGCQKVPRKVPPRFRGRFRQGSAKDSPSFRQGFTKVPLSFHQPRFSKFRAVSGSLSQVRLGLPKGSTKFPPSFVVSLVADPSLAAQRFILGCQEVHLGLPKGSAEGSTKVPPRFHRGSTKVSRRLRKFRDLSGLLGQVPFISERFCTGSPHHFFTFVSQFLQLFLAPV